MKAVDKTYELNLLTELPDAPTRHEGPHVGEYLRRLAIRLGKVRPDDVTDPFTFAPGEAAKLRMELGLAWEDRLVKRLTANVATAADGEWKEIIYHPGEFQYRGVWCTPDALIIRRDGRLVMPDFKCTWKSCGLTHDITDIWVWMHQMRAYKMCLEAAFECEVTPELWVYYLNGNYKPMTPVFKVWELYFTQEECEATWRLVEQELEVVRGERAAGRWSPT